MHVVAEHAASAARRGAPGAGRAAPRDRAVWPGAAMQRPPTACACGGGCPRCGAGSATRRLQARLDLGASNDPLELEADRIADQAMAPAGPAAIRRVTSAAGAPAAAAPASVEEVVSNPGRPLEPALRQDMEQRFGHDFSQVRVHAGPAAERSAADVSAQAYTVAPHVVFGAGRYRPQTIAGRRLIAHELAHVLQQTRAATGVVQRFADVDHHVIEEAALAKLFTKEQLEAIERGNTQRDYSQLSPFVNALLLGQATAFGGYARHEHFDNFVFDRARDRWVSHAEFDRLWDDNAGRWIKRRVPAAPATAKPRTTPPQYIEAELLAAVREDMPDAGAFEHLGNAFHTIEDFFAHSNFIELTQGDFTHGEELATHASHVEGPGSEGSIAATVFDAGSAAFFNERFRAEQATASPLSHGKLAKDFHGNANHELAVTLAALVIRQVALMLKEAFALATRAQREAFVRDSVLATLDRYLRPPSDKDRWWETMLAEDRGLMRRKVEQLQRATPVTVNQSPASPLRNVEATRFSPLKAIGMGTSLSIPIGDRKFLTIGHMLYLPGAGTAPVPTGLVLPPYVSDRDEKARLVSGFQFSGSFDENQWFKK